jgi:hypothetical protein
MTKDEAMKLALEALSTAHLAVEDDMLADEIQQAITAIKQALAAPIQKPVGALILGGVIDTSDGPEYEEWDVEWNTKAVEALQEKLVTSNGVTLMLYTTPPAQPAPAQGPYSAPVKEMWPVVPDAIGPNEDELPAYAAGWNDCRAEMLKERNNG